VVEQTLAGYGETIKERTIGVEIFGRVAAYETGNDPIVRVTAAEIRKRLGQYYAEVEHRDELRILLPIGSYTPHFEILRPQAGTQQAPAVLQLTEIAQEETEVIPVNSAEECAYSKSAAAFAPTDADLEGVPIAESPAQIVQPNHARRWAPAAITAALLASLLTAGGFLLHDHLQRTVFSYFWGPLLEDPNPALLCVSDQLQDTGIRLREASNPDQLRWHPFSERDNAFTTVALDNVNVLLNLVSMLQTNHKPYAAKGEQTTTMADLRNGPDVFVGGFDNAWTLRMVNKLRYRFANDPEMHYPRIVDSNEPNKPGWISDQSQVGSTGSYLDYGIVARFVDRDTGRPAVVVTGIGRCASLAAGQFVSTPENLVELERVARAAGNKPNLEIVFSSQVVDGHPGSPKILAFYSW
jgi:hypothetical protein